MIEESKNVNKIIYPVKQATLSLNKPVDSFLCYIIVFVFYIPFTFLSYEILHNLVFMLKLVIRIVEIAMYPDRQLERKEEQMRTKNRA